MRRASEKLDFARHDSKRFLGIGKKPAYDDSKTDSDIRRKGIGEGASVLVVRRHARGPLLRFLRPFATSASGGLLFLLRIAAQAQHRAIVSGT